MLRTIASLVISLLLPTVLCAQIDSLRQIALSIWQSDPARGFEIAEEVYDLAVEQDDKVAISWVYNYKGIVFSAIGEMDSSYHYYNQSLAYCDEHNIEETKFKSLMNLARNYSFQGRYEEAMQAYLDVVEIFEERGDTLGLAHAHSGMGNIHKQIGQSLKAKSDYQSSIAYYNAIGKPQFTGILFSNLGVVYRDAKQIDSAQYAFDRAEELLTSSNHQTGLGSLYLNEGGMYEATDPQKAISYYQKGYEINHELDDKRGVMIATLGIGQAQLNKGNWREALVHGQEGRSLAEEMDDLQHQELFSKLLYKAQKTGGNTALALIELERYKQLSDSVLNLESSNFISELEVQYETEKKEKQLAENALIISKNKADLVESELEIRKGNMRLMWAVLMMLVVGGIAAWIYLTQRRKRLAAQKEFKMQSQIERAENQEQIAQEKVRISEELHDNIGAQLTFMINSVENIHYRADGEVQEQLELVGKFGRDTMHELRNTIWAMNQTDGNSEVLEQKLAELKFKLSTSIPIEITNSIAPPIELKATQMLNCYRVVQEALQNVLKYAEASMVVIALSSPNGQTQLMIRDNGKGFNVTEATQGNGLRNMHKRALAIDGELQVTSSSEEGTTVLLSF